MTNIVVFASGSGTNFQAIIDAIEDGDITDGRITGLIAGKPDIGAIDRAHKAQIPVHILKKTGFPNNKRFSRQLKEILQQLEAEMLVLAGYLQKIPPEIIRLYRGKIINIHPSLLPSYGGKGYYGKRVHKAVLENGDTVSGCTVHFVTEEYDKGPIIEQRKVPVHSDDTPESLAKRVAQEEHKLLPSVIQHLIHNEN